MGMELPSLLFSRATDLVYCTKVPGCEGERDRHCAVARVVELAIALFWGRGNRSARGMDPDKNYRKSRLKSVRCMTRTKRGTNQRQA